MVLIKAIIIRLVKNAGLVLRGVEVYHVPGVPGTVCSGGLAGLRGREGKFYLYSYEILYSIGKSCLLIA